MVGRPLMGAMDIWIYLNDAGEIVLRMENDGWTFVNRGAEAVDKITTLDELEKSYPNLHKQALDLLAHRAKRDA
jgi:hypothetical protein